MNLFNRTISALVALTALVCACQKPELEPEISVTPDSITYASASPEAVCVDVKCNTSWTAETDVDWLILSATSGSGDDSIEVSAKKNSGEAGTAAAERTAQIIFRAGSKTAVVNVTQDGEHIVFAIDGKADVPAEGGTIVVSVEYNTPYSVNIPADATWITQAETKATATANLSFIVAANTTTSTRTATISFVPDSGDYQELTVSQEGLKPGIRTAEDFLAFVAAYNAGNGAQYDFDGDGVFTLEDDIDLSGKTWTPIGMPTATVSIPYNTANTLGNPFKEVFDGQGHKITGLTMSVDIQSVQTMGLFGSLNGATVKNLVLEGAKMSVKGSGITTSHAALGFIAGQSVDAVIENVKVNGTITGSATSSASRNVAVGGITGLLLSKSKVSTIKDCSFDGAISLDLGEKYSNTNTTEIAGIVGAVSSASSMVSKVQNCVNDATVSVKSHRAAGIVCNAFLVDIEGCTNNGAITCDYSANYVANVTGVRMGGIIAYCSEQNVKGQKVSKCVNNGLISTQEAGSVAGGVCGLIKCYEVSDCENYGDVIAPAEMRGLLIGVFQAATTESTISNCSLRGKIGAAADQSDATIANSSNYLTLGASFAAGVTCSTYTADNVHFIGTLSGPGISSAAELVAFAKAWNAGESIAQWQDGDFIVNLLGDIDCSSITEWEPIGPATFTWASNVLTVSGKPFTGHFDGNGFSLKNLAIKGSPAEAGTAFGLFGAITDGAVVENLVIDKSCSAEFTPSVSCDCGVLAGLVCDATVRGIVNEATVTAKSHTGDTRMSVATVGFAYSKAAECNIENVTNNGAISVDASGNTKNGATGVHVAGIVGFASNEASATTYVNVRGCVNNGKLVSSSARTSGIVAAANRYTAIENCTNNGSNTNSFATSGGGRIGNITCITGAGSYLRKCINNGDLISTTSARVGGLISLVNAADNKIELCENHGRIISDEAGYRGTMFGYCNVAATFSACIGKGDVGSYNGGTPEMVGITEANYIDYIGKLGSNCTTANSDNIWWNMKAGYDPDEVYLPDNLSASMPSVWTFQSSGTTSSTKYWTTKYHCVLATDGTDARITAVRGEANAATAFTYSVTGGKPYINTMVKDDYLLYSFPTKGVAAGSYVQFNTTLCPSSNTHKYWILEWFDGGQWKSDASKLYSASEDSSLKYTARLYYNSAYQYATVNQIVKFDAAVSDTLKIRMRAVGTYTCSGVAESVSTASSALFLPVFGFSAAYCNKVAVDATKKKAKVLCLGNSFSYYNHPVWRLQEIAASQGHELDVQCNLKGSQTLTDQYGLALSTEAINKAGYDYAFIQDQSQNPAKFASDPTTNASVNTYCKLLADKVRTASPSCQVILENTWSFTSGTYGGFNSYENFDALLASGCQTMATNANTWISPIGQAFALCRSTYPSINLYHSDSKHQGPNGAYLKACVNYLVIFGEKFDSNAANCGLDATVAANLRSIAEQVVLGHESDYKIVR